MSDDLQAAAELLIGIAGDTLDWGDEPGLPEHLIAQGPDDLCVVTRIHSVHLRALVRLKKAARLLYEAVPEDHEDRDVADAMLTEYYPPRGIA